jgi:hypothetical protein
MTKNIIPKHTSGVPQKLQLASCNLRKAPKSKRQNRNTISRHPNTIARWEWAPRISVSDTIKGKSGRYNVTRPIIKRTHRQLQCKWKVETRCAQVGGNWEKRGLRCQTTKQGEGRGPCSVFVSLHQNWFWNYKRRRKIAVKRWVNLIRLLIGVEVKGDESW